MCHSMASENESEQAFGLSDHLLHICILPVHELICKQSIRLRYVKLYNDTFVMIIRILS